MNKTRKRAIQKHRAKALKFEMRRKREGDSGTSKSRQTAASSAASARQKAPARRRDAADDSE